MKQKKHPKQFSLGELYDYIFARKGEKSRHMLEKQMQQNPFLHDAVEGLTMVDEERAKQDIHQLNKQIRQKHSTSINKWVMGIAATLALFIIAGLGYWVVVSVQNTYNETRFTQQPQVQVPESVPDVPDPEPLFTESTPTEQELNLSSQPPVVADVLTPPESPPAIKLQEDRMMAENEMVIITDHDIIQNAVSSGRSRPAAHFIENIGESLRDAVIPDRAAIPVEGFDAFWDYIKKNALLPDTASIQQANVVLAFEINHHGEPVNFEIVSTENKVYSQMAIRLIEQGPL